MCQFPTPRTCLSLKLGEKSLSSAPTLVVLNIEEWKTRQWLVLFVKSVVWWVQLHKTHWLPDLFYGTAFLQKLQLFFVAEVFFDNVWTAVIVVVALRVFG